MQSTRMLRKQKAAVRTQTERKPRGKKLQLTERDLALFRLLLEFRVMETKHIMSFLNRDTRAKQTYYKKRLLEFFNEGYIDRPARMNQWVIGGGSHDTIHALSNKGRKVLIEKYPGMYAGVSVRADNKTLKANFIDHQLFTTEIMMHIYEGCRERDDMHFVTRSRFIREMATEEFYNRPGQHNNNANGWPVHYEYEKNGVRQQEKGTLIPDYIFYIEEIKEGEKTGKRFYIMIEADRGTEPNERIRSKGVLSDIWSKMIMYDQTAKQKLLTRYFGVEASFVILFVGKTAERCTNMIRTNRSPAIRGGRGWKNFFFAPRGMLDEYGFLDVGWLNGKDDKVIQFRDITLK